ncbi:MAG: hypothetical protein ABIO70_06495 [Pseudomonadota bacterium]
MCGIPNPGGSWAGWAADYGGDFPYTTSSSTPVEGLYQARAWVHGAGQSVALASGMAAAEAALDAMDAMEE